MHGKTLIIFKITPTSFERIDELIKTVKQVKNGEVKDVRKEAIGFGIEVVKAGVLINEKEEGALERLEKELNEIELVERVEVEGMTLL